MKTIERSGSIKSRKKVLFICSVITILILLLLLIILTKQSPLKVSGYTTEDSGKTVILEIINRGIFNVDLVDVLVNDNYDLETVELGVSYTQHLVLGSGLDEDPDIKFVEINKVKIGPELSPNDIKYIITENSGTPIDYGIRIISNQQINEVMVTYKYIGLTFKKSFIVADWPMSNF